MGSGFRVWLCEGLAGAALAGAVFADTIELRSGETLEGRVTLDEPEQVRILVKVTPSISEERVISRADIVSLSTVSADDAAFRDVKAKAVAPRFCNDPADYTAIVEGVIEPFLEKYPASAHAAEVKALIAQFEDEKTRIVRGSPKVGGEFLSPEIYQSEKYQVEAAILAGKMESALNRGDLVSAGNDCDALFTKYPNSTACVEARPAAKKCLSALAAKLDWQAQNARIKLAELEKAADRAPQEQKAETAAAVEAEKSRAAQLAKRAADRQVKFYEASDIDAAGLEAMKKAADAGLEMLADTENEKVVQAAKDIRLAEKYLAEYELWGARSSARNAVQLWPDYEGAKRLCQRIEDAIRSHEESSRRQAEYIRNQQEINEPEKR